MDAKLNLAVVGPGLIGLRHLSIAAAHPEVRLTALVGGQSPRNVAASEQFNLPLFPDMRAATINSDIDAVIISSPNHFHFEQAAICLNAGLAVLVEKPMTDSLDSARRLYRMTVEKGGRLLVGHHRMHSSYIVAAKEYIRSDHFGRPVTVHGSALFYKPSHYFDDGPWRRTKGGGPLLINMIHEISVLRYLYGEITEVSALNANEQRQFEVEDTSAICFRFQNGALGTFILSDAAASTKSWEMTTGENSAYPRAAGENCYHFSGSRGSLDFPTMRARHYPDEATRSWWTRPKTRRQAVKPTDPLEAQFGHFLAVARGRAAPVVSALDGYRNMLVLDAIVASAAERTPMKVSAIEDAGLCP